MPENRENGGESGPRPFWSGTLAFGLVNFPVRLYAATRGGGSSLRMIDEDGTPLVSRYVCPREERPVSRDELVRGYDVSEGGDPDRWIVVTDEELESLQPEKSREIDLHQFVPVDQLDPVFFDRPYVLAPGEGSNKAYRLLVRVMEETGRAGVASFVMRTREYLVAILAQEGILRAETMRFHDEIRTPEDVGLPAVGRPADDLVEDLVQAVEGLRRDDLDRTELADRDEEALEALVEARRKKGEGLVEIPEDARRVHGDPGQVIDLLEVLRRSLEGGGEGRRPPARAVRKERGATEAARELAEKTKDELYETAREMDIPGRSGMTKDELVRAILRAG